MCGGEEGALGVGRIKIHYVYVYSCHQLHKSLVLKKKAIGSSPHFLLPTGQSNGGLFLTEVPLPRCLDLFQADKTIK